MLTHLPLPQHNAGFITETEQRQEVEPLPFERRLIAQRIMASAFILEEAGPDLLENILTQAVERIQEAQRSQLFTHDEKEWGYIAEEPNFREIVEDSEFIRSCLTPEDNAHTDTHILYMSILRDIVKNDHDENRKWPVGHPLFKTGLYYAIPGALISILMANGALSKITPYETTELLDSIAETLLVIEGLTASSPIGGNSAIVRGLFYGLIEGIVVGNRTFTKAKVEGMQNRSRKVYLSRSILLGFLSTSKWGYLWIQAIDKARNNPAVLEKGIDLRVLIKGYLLDKKLRKYGIDVLEMLRSEGYITSEA